MRWATKIAAVQQIPIEESRLAVYGTLRPGQPNHHVLAEIPGRWLEGHVHGRLVEEGWGAALGSPGIVLDHGAPAVKVWVLESADLPSHWSRLDGFEGLGYSRIPVIVRVPNGELSAFIYALTSLP